MAEKMKTTDKARYVKKPANHNEPMNWQEANPEQALRDLVKANPGILDVFRGSLPKSGR